MFSLFSNIFFINKQLHKIEVEGFSEKPSTSPNFFICLYFIGVGGDENLKNYLVWPNCAYIFK